MNIRRRLFQIVCVTGATLLLLLCGSGVAFAQNTTTEADLIRGMNTIWVLITAFLVFFMQAGFAFLEAGSTREKNTVNILIKNILDFSIATVAFWVVGYAFMFGEGTGLIGLSHFFLIGLEDDGTLPALAFWLFQLVFAGTAATIVSGAMAERTRFSVYLLFSIVMGAFIYPIFGHWAWSEYGWLNNLPLGNGFMDFAGSTVVHSVGGWAALAGAMLLGPRIGRFDTTSPANFQGHSVPLATLGVFILWLGWFGFNPGSQLSTIGANADTVALVAVNTNFAAAVGGISALVISRLHTGQWRLITTLNGVLGGLVAITASCNVVDQFGALVIGMVGGILVTYGTEWLARLKIDDPVGAVPVHLFAGIWGTLAVGLFGREIGVFYGGGFDQLLVQLLGIVVCAIWSGGASMLAFLIIQRTVGLRVSLDVEHLGLDNAEHGEVGYRRFVQSPEEEPSPKPRPEQRHKAVG
ncbi:MAG: ammonium transporter [Chloroflexaceae bacterium]|nr:ammonium transporter [Chloroflexaceae bacterium]